MLPGRILIEDGRNELQLNKKTDALSHPDFAKNNPLTNQSKASFPMFSFRPVVRFFFCFQYQKKDMLRVGDERPSSEHALEFELGYSAPFISPFLFHPHVWQCVAMWSHQILTPS